MAFNDRDRDTLPRSGDAVPGRDIDERRDRLGDGEPDANRDPITGTPGAHPVGVGAGAAAGGATGAAIGAIGGPIGAVVGAVVGGIAGGLVGKGVGEAVNPTAEDEYWKSNYAARPYVKSGETYDRWKPAYGYGVQSYSTHGTKGRAFDEVESDLSREWATRRGTTNLEWNDARPAVRDAWDRLTPRRNSGSELRDDTADALNDLVQICKDGAHGFNLAADRIHDDDVALAADFRQYASERESFARELQSHVSRVGEEPTDRGDMAGALHRGWINIKSAVTGGDRKAIINECERGEDAAVEAYQKALNDTRLTAQARAVVQRQFPRVKAVHDRISAMKHALGD